MLLSLIRTSSLSPLLLVSFLLAPALAAPSYDYSTVGYSGYSGYDSSSPGYSGYSGYDSSTAGYSGMGGYSGYSGDGSGSLERTEKCEDTIPDCTFLKFWETAAPPLFAAQCAQPNFKEGCCVTYSGSLERVEAYGFNIG